MADVVDSARQKWPIYFSKFYEVTMISGESTRVFAPKVWTHFPIACSLARCQVPTSLCSGLSDCTWIGFLALCSITGPSLPTSSFIVDINWQGISFQDDKNKQLLELTYPEVTAANITRYIRPFGSTFATHPFLFLLCIYLADTFTQSAIHYRGEPETSQYAQTTELYPPKSHLYTTILSILSVQQ